MSLTDKQMKDIAFQIDMMGTHIVMGSGGAPNDLVFIHTRILASSIVSCGVTDHLSKAQAMATLETAIVSLRKQVAEMYEPVQKGMIARGN
jgi:hypothetical protein